MYGYKGKKFFNIKTGAIVESVTDSLNLGDDWKNMSDNPGWYPLFDVEGNYAGYRPGKKGFIAVETVITEDNL
jgi:hypothetical protein